MARRHPAHRMRIQTDAQGGDLGFEIAAFEELLDT